MPLDAYTAATKIARDYFKSDITLQPILEMGTCNQVFIASSPAEKIIVRLNNDRSLEEFIKESWFMEEMSKAGISVATSLGNGIYQDWNYNLQTFLAGRNGKDFPDKLAIWKWLGSVTAQLAQNPVDINAIDPRARTFTKDWPKYIADNISSLHEERFSRDIGLTSKNIDYMKQSFEKIVGHDFNFGLCHGDMMPSNVLVDEDGTISLIDFGCAEIHIVPHYEIMEILRHNDLGSPEIESFLNGAGLHSEWEHLKPEIEGLMLLRSFDLVRWACDRKPEVKEEKVAELHHLIDRFTHGLCTG